MVRLQVLPLVLVVAMVVTAATSAQAEQTSDGQDVVSASTLTRIHAVNPTWPPSAAAGLEGWVLLSFTVMPNGAVTDVAVSASSPSRVFEDSAVEALQQWTFEPVERDGKKVAQRAEIRFNYAQPK